MIGAFQFAILDWSTEVVNWIIRIVIAAFCGFIIGFERKSRSKEAGIRTHTIVCFAAALMMIVSKYCFVDLWAA
ncbi:MAG: MgtC/SapB family protein, partial [Clostridia bacterium]|nr:MgtC/SapB family protein [Clostridia bacterium]